MASSTVLLVEDNPDDEALTKRALASSNIDHDIVVVRDGVEALDYLFGTGTHSGRDTRIVPDVVLLDLKLPKVDGFQVLQKVRADDRTKLLPVVIFSSSFEEQDLIDSYRLGANAYFSKPVDFGEFVEAVQQMGRFWLGLNRVPPRASALRR